MKNRSIKRNESAKLTQNWRISAVNPGDKTRRYRVCLELDFRQILTLGYIRLTRIYHKVLLTCEFFMLPFLSAPAFPFPWALVSTASLELPQPILQVYAY